MQYRTLTSVHLYADYDPLLIRLLEDDLYGNNTNFELALSKEAADVWRGIAEEAARRVRMLELEAVHAAAERSKPRAKRVRKVKPWQSMGSEVGLLLLMVFGALWVVHFGLITVLCLCLPRYTSDRAWYWPRTASHCITSTSTWG